VNTAVEKLSSYFSNEFLITDSSILSKFVENCSSQWHLPAALIKVRTPEEISIALRISNEFKTPVYPYSTGHNWGYGSRSPYKPGCVLLDLSLMNRILDFNQNTGVVTVEPGVTQQNLFDFLRSGNFPFLVPTTGAGPDTSLLANALEHGFGITPQTDHALSIMSVEAILPNGTLYRSDFAEQGATQLDSHFKWSIGPYLDGIFTQSNFGVVTKISIALSYKASHISGLYFTLKSEDEFGPACRAVQRIMHLYPNQVGGINLMNDLRVIAMSMKSPSSQALRPEQIKSLRDQLGISSWSGAGSLYCEKSLAAVIEKDIRRILSPHCAKLVFLNRARLKKIAWLSKFIPRKLLGGFPSQIKKIEESLDLFEGRPSLAALPLIYWRSQQKPSDAHPLDPDQGDVGLIWYAPIAILDPQNAIAMNHIIQKVCRANDIDPLITFTSFNPRVFDLTIPILFNRKDPKQTANALKCHDELIEAGAKLGSRPYRYGVHSSQKMIQENNFWRLQRTIKKAVDPNNILSPGRYSLD
jgi:4-cresol dehydrogenase (hydroxylating)